MELEEEEGDLDDEDLDELEEDDFDEEDLKELEEVDEISSEDQEE